MPLADNTLHATLAGWGNFYLITGTAAAALTGLQFVVQTLLASSLHRAMDNTDPEGGISAFGTPTVVHFSLSLLLSAMLCAPWPGYAGLRVSLWVVGVGALLYSVVVLRRARRQQSYAATAYDWTWHVILPVVAYASVVVAGMMIGDGRDGPLFALAAATMLLLCIGIHNAWDTVTYLTLRMLRGNSPEQGQ
jgi:cytochrome bd-type quinol oxidase subunit 2